MTCVLSALCVRESETGIHRSAKRSLGRTESPKSCLDRASNSRHWATETSMFIIFSFQELSKYASTEVDLVTGGRTSNVILGAN